MTNNYTFPHYLAAKRSVDDRALNRHVWETLVQAVAVRQAAINRPLAVLEVGAGIGTMVQRVLDWRLFAPQQEPVAYTAIDAQPDNIRTAHDRLQDLPDWLALHLESADVLEFCERPQEQGHYDVLMAHAFLDLLDLATALPLLRKLLRPGGLFYFTINFDGATILQPTVDATIDAEIELAYHCTMDERLTDGVPSGDSCTGRHLFGRLAAAGYHVQAAGSSDWVVHPVGGAYPADEAFFLHFIVHTMHSALQHQPSILKLPGAAAFEQWIETRHAQIDRGELIYIAHQLDFMGSV